MPAKRYFSFWLIQWLCKEEWIEEIEGNLLEYKASQADATHWLAQLKYWWQVLSYFRPTFLKLFQQTNFIAMFNFHLKFAFRNLRKHRTTAFINLLGFTVGLSSVIVLYFYTQQEQSYDRFHKDKERIYRAYRTNQDETGGSYDIGLLSPPFSEALKTDFPQSVEATMRIRREEGLVTFGAKSFMENRILLADPNFFTFFSYPLKAGNAETVLEGANNIVISERMAQKYFGTQNPIGKVLTIDQEYDFTVTGIMRDLGQQRTHIAFDMVASLAFYGESEYFENWFPNSITLYLKLKQAKEAVYLTAQFPAFMEKHLGSYFREHNQRNGLKIIPLEEVYFHNAQYEVDNIKQGNQRNVIILGLVALAILFIASFSYVNLSIAKALERGKEVGVRKTLGANRGQVVFQFLVETKVILLIAMALAITCCLLIRPLLNNTFNLDITFNWMSSEALIFLVILFFVLLLAAGLYPALVLGAFKPLTVLRKNYLSQGRSLFLRKGLITVQFCLAIFLVSVTCFTYLQVQYMNDKDLGYTTERTLVIDPSGGAIYDTLNTFRQILAAHPNIKSITGASGEPSGFHDVYGITFKPGTEPIRANTVFTDVHYLKTLDIEVIKGRAFDPSRKTDRESAMMINEQVLKELGVSAEEVIGNVVDVPFREYKRKVIGVFEDYHFMDLRAAVQPQAIIMDEEVRRIIIKIGAGDVTETLVFIEDTYNSFSAGYPMNSTFLEDSLAQQYQTEQQQATLFSLFSGISIVLACLGIFGLVSFSANRRQKEMSIRKVFGASASQILLILSKEYVQLVGLSALLSLPIIWYYLSDWLDDYAYRIDLFSYSPVFILASTLTLIVAFLAIVIKAYKAAVVNPAEIMRYE